MTDFDIAAKLDLIIKAQAMVDEDKTKFRDEGTCVLGAGIAVDYRPPRARKDRRKVIIQAPFQGNVGSHRACERALAFLREQGVEAFWYDGVMD